MIDRARGTGPGRHHRRTAHAAALALTAALALGACSDGHGDGHGEGHGKPSGEALEVTGAYMPEPVMTGMAGGFLIVENHGDQDEKLTEVTSGLADTVEIHRTENQQMQQADSLPVPAGGALELERGGSHLMFHDLKRKPAEGDTVTVTLHFAHHDPVTVSLPVKARNHDPSHGTHQ